MIKKTPSLPIYKLFPNVVTITGLCFGLSAIKYTFDKRWELSVIFIIISIVIDGMDGRIARLLQATSSFGAQLDSLADFLNFGIAPALLLYFWVLNNIKIFGWISVMMYVICMIIRLSRFNVMLEDEEHKPLQDIFFVGIPAPAGALLILMPVILSFINYKNIFNLDAHAIIIYMIIISFLVVSRIPTFSLKKLQIPRNLSSLIIFIFSIIIILIINNPWRILPIIGITYLISIPISAITYLYLTYK